MYYSLPECFARFLSKTITVNYWFACDVMAAMLVPVYNNNRVVITFFVVYTNMAAILFVI